MENFSLYIDRWLLEPTSDGFERFDPAAAQLLLEQRISDAWEHGRDAERKSLLQLRQALLDYQNQLRMQEEIRLSGEQLKMNEIGVPLFLSLSQALNFLAEKLEGGDSAALQAACAHQRHPAGDPQELKAFWERLFPALQEYQRQQDFRQRYLQHRFPEDTDRFSLGGHMAELGGIAIEFTRVEPGWVLEGIYAYR
jgi:hypothetical protein